MDDFDILPIVRYGFETGFQSEIVGPPDTNRSNQEPISFDVPYEIGHYFKVPAQLSFDWYRDFPLTVKSGMIVIKLRWEI